MMHQQTHLGGLTWGRTNCQSESEKKGGNLVHTCQGTEPDQANKKGGKHLIRLRADGRHAINPPHTVCPNYGFKFSVGAWLARNGRRMVNWPLAHDWVAARLCQKRTSGLRKSYITNKRTKNSGLSKDTYILICATA